jgi:voltage-gated potassium channel
MFGYSKYLKELYVALIIVLTIPIVGVVGYMVIEDYSFVEAFYMTIITISTVGFKEIRELSDLGRYFTSFLILVSFGTFAYTLSLISQYLITGTLQRYYKKYRMNAKIEKLEGHVVICGAGRNGMKALQTLLSYHKKVVIIEQDPEIIEELRDEGLYFIEGDATEEEALVKAGIHNASALVSSLPKDTDNVFVVLTARELNPDIRIVSRCLSDSSESKLKIAGANAVIMPDKVGGARMAGFIINHNINRFLDTLALQNGNEVYLKELSVNHIDTKETPKTIDAVLEALNTSCKIVGIMSPEFEYIVNPKGTYQIPEDSQLIFFGSMEEIANLEEYFSAMQ